MKMFRSMIMVAVMAMLSFVAMPAMAQYDGTTNAVVPVVRPSMITASGTNGVVFTNGVYLGTGLFVLSVTNWAGSTPTMDSKLQGSTDQVTWTDVTGGAFTQVTTTNSIQALAFRMQDLPQYLHFTNTITGTTVTNLYSITLVAPQKYR